MECPICGDEIASINLGCSHALCPICIDQMRSFQCPLCRHDFRSEIPEKHSNIIYTNIASNRESSEVDAPIDLIEYSFIQHISKIDEKLSAVCNYHYFIEPPTIFPDHTELSQVYARFNIFINVKDFDEVIAILPQRDIKEIMNRFCKFNARVIVLTRTVDQVLRNEI